MDNRIQIRLNERDRAAFDRLAEFLKTRNPWQEPGDSDVIRLALRIATGQGGLLCPYCDAILEEQKIENGEGTLGIWVCPHCAEGNGAVTIET